MSTLLLLLSAGYLDRAELVTLETDFSAGSSVAVSEQPWWPSFGDPTLNQLVERSLQSNYGLASGSDRAQQASSQSWAAFSPLVPSLSVDFGHQIKPCPEIGFVICELSVPIDPATGQRVGEVPDTYSLGSLYLNAAMRVDIFGQQYNTAKAGRLEAAAALGDVESQSILLSAMVAGAWFDLLTAQEQLSIAEQQVVRSLDLLEIVTLRHERSDATTVDLLQQRQALAQAQSVVPSARMQVRIQEQQLAVLLGADPRESLGLVGLGLPSLPPAPSVGDPESLWQTRPDLRAQADRVEAAKRRERATNRAALPTVGLSAQTGLSYQDILELESQQQWMVGASVSVPIFAGGMLVAGTQAARADTDAAVNSANNAYLQAVAEVEIALVRESEAAVIYALAQTQVEAASLAYELAREQYLSGVSSYLQISALQGALFGAELSQLSAERSLLGARISLHQALGGSWTQAAP